jgi:hypothetical protein
MSNCVPVARRKAEGIEARLRLLVISGRPNQQGCNGRGPGSYGHGEVGWKTKTGGSIRGSLAVGICFDHGEHHVLDLDGR